MRPETTPRRGKRPIAPIVPATVVLGCAPGHRRAAEAAPDSRWSERSIRSDGQVRWSRICEPPNLSPAAPMVIVLHGGGQSMRRILRPTAGGTRAWVDVARRHGVLLVAPNGVDARTADTRGDDQARNDLRPAGIDRTAADDVAFITALADTVVAAFAADPRRVHVTGVLNGGMMTHRLPIEAPGRFAAAATFIAALPADVPLEAPARRPILACSSRLGCNTCWHDGTGSR